MSARAPAALVLLSAVPLAAGALRLVQLAGGPAVIPADDRFAGFPAALVVHILGASVQPGTGPLLLVLRLVVAPAMAACLLLGVAASRRGDVDGHRAWMVRRPGRRPGRDHAAALTRRTPAGALT